MSMRGTYERHGKRALDVAVSGVLLLATSPLQLACAVGVLLDSGRPVLFTQTRSGRGGRPFRIYKFRTMAVGTHERTGGYPTSDMVTRTGRVLRRTNLDELPQLWNILRGEMSLVGPRPTLPDQVERYTERQRGRLRVRPGVTGRSQVRYRNNAPWSARIEEDLKYVENVSVLHDLRLLLATIPVALSGQGQIMGQRIDQVDDLGTGDFTSAAAEGKHDPTGRRRDSWTH